MKTFRNLALVCAFALMSAACTSQLVTTLASSAVDLATSVSSNTPAQVKTYAQATLGATIAAKTLGIAADVTNDVATLQVLDNLNESVHSAWLKLKEANDAHQSLNFAAFNAALAAYQTFRVHANVPEASVDEPKTSQLDVPALVARYNDRYLATRVKIAHSGGRSHVAILFL